VNADGSGETKLTSGTASLPKEGAANFAFTPDGASLFYDRQPDAVFAHFTKTTPIRRTLAGGAEAPFLAGKPAGDLRLSHDGKLLAIAEPRHGSLYLQSDVVVRDVATGAERANARGIDRNVKWFAFAPDDAALYVATPDGVRNVLWRQPLAGGTPTKVDLGDVDFAPDATIAKNGTIAFVGQTMDRPPELYALRSGATAPERITDENATFAKTFAFGKSERIDWTTDDGMRACGVVTYPPDATPGKKYPLIVLIHGGPVSTSTRDFSTQIQAMAAHGFVVFQPNYRGSDDLGDAYLQAIVGHVTSGPGRDNLLGVEAVKKLGIVDEARMGVSGWSGGGLQTSWLIGHTHEFKAAVSGAAVNDWYEQAMLADINEEFAQVFIPGPTPFTPAGRAAYRAESPITFANAVTTPTLILSDTGDQRVPITQAYAFYHALKDKGTHVEFEAWPRSGHFPTDPVGRESVLRAWMDWFDRWLK
jgi:dipeptidyl aminopeptidase/acylaminoacyl peptidase